MPNEKNSEKSDVNALAAEALDLWQEHLATYATDPKAKSELVKLMEPTRRWFAEWATMMQHGAYGANVFTQNAGGQKSAATARATAARPSSDDVALSLAQLTHHVAVLEKHMAELEKRLARCETGKSAPRAKPTK
jgi:ribosomal protein S15P/S13E